jgi:hydrogenase maturation protease
MNGSGTNRKVVLGLGNVLNRDEGVGVHALNKLRDRLQPFNHSIELLDGGVLGLNLLPLVEECSHLLLLDAVDAHKQPGTVIELKADEIRLFSGIKLSDHQVTFQEVLGLASFRSHFPRHLYLVGAQPADLSTGMELSSTLRSALPEIVERAVSVLREWGLLQ